MAGSGTTGLPYRSHWTRMAGSGRYCQAVVPLSLHIRPSLDQNGRYWQAVVPIGLHSKHWCQWVPEEGGTTGGGVQCMTIPQTVRHHITHTRTQIHTHSIPHHTPPTHISHITEHTPHTSTHLTTHCCTLSTGHSQMLLSVPPSAHDPFRL